MNPYAEASGKELTYIQTLRGIASLAVVLWHASRFVSPYGTGLGTSLFEGGGVLGVDLFFIISGFIMVHTTAGDDSCSYSGVWNFFVKRFARIWPVYVIWTLAYVVCRFDVAAYLVSEPNRLRLIQSFTFVPFSNGPGSYDYPALVVGWTINYEAYFYLIFGLSMLLGRARWYALWVCLIFGLLGLPWLLGHPLAFAHTSYGLVPAYLNIVSDPIVWFFGAGTLIGLIEARGYRIRSLPWAKAAVGLAVALTVLQYVARFRIGHGVTYWGLSLIPLVLILTLTRGAGMFNGPVTRVSGALGNISYSLYLVHPLVQEHLEYLFHQWGAGRVASGFFFMGVTTAVSIWLATLSFKYLESGLSNWVRDRLIARTGRASRRAAAAVRLDSAAPQRLAWHSRLLVVATVTSLALVLLAALDWTLARRPAASTASTAAVVVHDVGLWADGWLARDFTLSLIDRDKANVSIRFLNASPLEQKLTLKAGGEPRQIVFAPGAMKIITFSSADAAVLNGTVAPGFVPKASGGGGDTRQLGLHVEFLKN